MSTFDEKTSAAAQQLIDLALREDLGDVGDLSSQSVISESATGTVRIVARESGIVSGLPVVKLVFAALDNDLSCEFSTDATAVEPGTIVGTISGQVRSLLSGERTALNFLSHLSGIATHTKQFVEQVKGTRAKILDTRKTLPGWRLLQKYAVTCGGGTNHRMGLHDAIMLKDNHLAAWSDASNTLSEATAAARRFVADKDHSIQFLQVEVDTLEQFEVVLKSSPDIILLDNMSAAEMRKAVELRNQSAPDVLLEASGGITLNTVRAAAETGVDRISIGALTHSVRALDFGFDWASQA